MIVSATGHRPPKIGGYKLPNPTYIKICQKTEQILKELNPTKCISGFALGFDSYFANVVLKLGIPLVAAVPFLGQEKAWPEKSQKLYYSLLKRASEVIVISKGEYSPKMMQIRNEWMVDNSQIVLACFDGSKGGTYNCIQYATLKDKKIIYINPKDF